MLDDYVYFLDDSRFAIDESHEEAFRPLGLFLLSQERALFANRPAGYHVVNFTFFVSACYLFYVFLRFLLMMSVNSSRDSWQVNAVACIASALYALHPINSFLLNYKTASYLIFYVILVVLSLYFFLVSLKSSVIAQTDPDQEAKVAKVLFLPKATWISLFCFFSALFVYEFSVLVPGYIFIITYIFLKFDVRRSIKICLPYVAVLVLYMLARLGYASTVSSASIAAIRNIWTIDMTMMQYMATLSRLIGWYLGKLVVPNNIIFIWDERIVSATESLWYGLTALAGLIGVSVVCLRARGRVWSLGLALLACGFLPMVVASFTYTPMLSTAIIEPHWFAVSSIGFFLVIANVLSWSLHRRVRVPGLIVISCLLIGLALWTRRSSRIWKYEEQYCTYWLQQNSLNGEAGRCFARSYIRRHDAGPQPVFYKNCRELAYLGWAYHSVSLAQRAYEYYQNAITMNEYCDVAYYGLSLVLWESHYPREAQEVFKTATTINANVYPLFLAVKDVFEGRSVKDSFQQIERLWQKYYYLDPGYRIP